MTSTFASYIAASRTCMHASVGGRALAIVTPMQDGVVLLPRSPGPGRP